MIAQPYIVVDHCTDEIQYYRSILGRRDGEDGH